MPDNPNDPAQVPPNPSARDQLLQGMEEVDSTQMPEPGQTPSSGAGQPPSEPPPDPQGQQPPQDSQAPPPPVEGQGEPGPEPAGEEPPRQPTQTEQIAEALRAMGWQGEDPNEAPQAMLDAFQRQSQQYQQMQDRLSEQEELARYGTEYLKEQRERKEADQKAQQAQQGQSKPEHWWSPPQFDQQTIEQYKDVTIGQDGQPQATWKPNTPREVIENAEAYQRYLDRWATDLVQRPQEVLPKVIEQEFDRLFEERISQREQTATVESFAQQVREDNKDWMYTTDPRGQEVLTREGQQMTQLLSEVAEAGISDPRMQWEYAVARFDYLNDQARQQQQGRSEQATQTAQQQRQSHVDRGSGRTPPNRGGTVPKPEDSGGLPQNPNLSPGQQLVEQLKQHGEEMW